MSNDVAAPAVVRGYSTLAVRAGHDLRCGASKLVSGHVVATYRDDRRPVMLNRGEPIHTI